ncbi:MAG: DUF3419 family protein [Deltaproteobacteria bacterium]|nr:DUF3419 family protein [Deltaproteobacteria bacterium]
MNLIFDSNQDKLYRWSSKIWKYISLRGKRFHQFSAPYLFATECPWFAWRLAPSREEDEIVITVAGSGDNPLFFLYQGYDKVIAVDISIHACMWNELKRALIKTVSFHHFQIAYSALINQRTLPIEMVQSAFRFLSEEARNYWKQGYEKIASFVRPTDTLLAWQTFYLKSPDKYEILRQRIKNYPLINLPIETFLGHLQDNCADILYFSNIYEYLRLDNETRATAYIKRLLECAAKVVKPGGYICFYETSSMSSIEAYYCSLLGNDLHPLIQEFRIKPRAGFTFRHCLITIPVTEL